MRGPAGFAGRSDQQSPDSRREWEEKMGFRAWRTRRWPQAAQVPRERKKDGPGEEPTSRK